MWCVSWCVCVLQGVGEPVNGTQGRKSSSVGLQNSNQCRQSLPLGPNVNWTFTADGRLESGSGVCLSVEKTPGAQLWSKPLSDSKVAVLVLNTLKQPQSFALPLADVPGLKCGAGGCAVRDVWRQQDNGTVTGQLAMDLASHQTAYMILSAGSA